ncbi:hypothetical protein R3P38DRAFT_2862891 [Favolaschia claudopus]|uniref:F-box domain-containing protein n=1 Tax=Favolaschia claudopus TaxID=2862362 RepID=A0AAW0DC96_9AGAR
MVFVVSHDSHLRLSPPHSTVAMARPRTTPLPVLPPELWLYIHRIALGDLWPETQADAVTYHLEGDLHRYLKVRTAMLSWRFGVFCRGWHTLTQDLLYPHVWLNYSRNWSYISNAVSQPHIAALVRNVRLSPDARCASHIELVVQPEFPRTERVYTGPLDEPLPDLPLSQTLKLQHLAISSSSSIDSSFFRSASFPPLHRLRSLLVIGLPRTDISAFLRHSHLTSLEELTISPITVSFAVILDLFPQLMELRYSIASSLIPPTGGQFAASLVCVHLLSHNTPTPYSINPHCLLFLGPALGALERVWEEWRSIEDRGCVVEMEKRPQ